MRIGRVLGVVTLVVLLAVVLWLAGGGRLPSLPSAVPPGATEPDVPGDEGAAPAASGTPEVPADAGEAWVRYVHDGDTLFLEDGRKVRLLGIDTPEVGEHLECLGDEATAALRAVLPEGTHVRTVADVQGLDQYGRSLLFLFTDDGALVNLDLIRSGYAEAVVLEPNVLWAAELEAAEDEAQAASRGIWGVC
ncbi:thermonuclease family protein [Protaetiibacter intestinalis]|uniref:thermonuclease family protein n=1 Tax=Protaetiibacter intestinalis TaxID=2419774 RepID=UPI0013002C3C|nr:thermonuclease family protein [Protaetiibacter intestinalis]